MKLLMGLHKVNLSSQRERGIEQPLLVWVPAMDWDRPVKEGKNILDASNPLFGMLSM